MKLIRKFIFSASITILFSCESDKHDPYIQSEQDDKDITTYLKGHYYNKELDSIKEVDNDQSPLSDLVKYENISYNEVNYKLYYYVINEGDSEFGINPSPQDSVFTKYRGRTLNDIVFDSNEQVSRWIYLPSTIIGWSLGMPKFKSGELIDNGDGTFKFENYGKGILIIPSGLAYGPFESGNIKANSPLIFNILALDSVNITENNPEKEDY